MIIHDNHNRLSDYMCKTAELYSFYNFVYTLRETIFVTNFFNVKILQRAGLGWFSAALTSDCVQSNCFDA